MKYSLFISPVCRKASVIPSVSSQGQYTLAIPSSTFNFMQSLRPWVSTSTVCPVGIWIEDVGSSGRKRKLTEWF